MILWRIKAYSVIRCIIIIPRWSRGQLRRRWWLLVTVTEVRIASKNVYSSIIVQLEFEWKKKRETQKIMIDSRTELSLPIRVGDDGPCPKYSRREKSVQMIELYTADTRTRYFWILRIYTSYKSFFIQSFLRISWISGWNFIADFWR